MNKRVPRITGVDLSSTIRTLMYKDIVACEMIMEDVFEHQNPTCEVQSYIVFECNEDDKEEEHYDKGIDKEQATQYKKKNNLLRRRWWKIVRTKWQENNFKMKINLEVCNVYTILCMPRIRFQRYI